MAFLNLTQYLRRRFRPNERLRAFVMFGHEISDRPLQFGNAAKGSTLKSLSRDLGKKALDGVEPRGAGRGEMRMEAWMRFKPGFDKRMLVGRVVIHDDMHV